MTAHKGWPILAFDNQDLQLPPRPGIKRSVCPRCGTPHFRQDEAIRCLQQNASQDQ